MMAKQAMILKLMSSDVTEDNVFYHVPVEIQYFSMAENPISKTLWTNNEFSDSALR